MSNNFMDQVKIAVGDRYTIAVSKDHAKGLIVQVARLNPTHVSTDQGVVFKGHQPAVIWSKVVTLGTVAQGTGMITFKPTEQIQKELAAAVNQAQGIAAGAVAMENGVDGLLKQLNAELNK